METKQLSVEECNIYLPLIQPWVQQAMDYSAGESTIQDVMQKLSNGLAQCWLHFNSDKELIALSVTEVIQYMRKRSLHVITHTALSNRFDEIGEQHQYLEDFAKENNCDTVVAWCRKGWSRVLDRFPFPSGRRYKQSYVVMEMEINK